MESRVKRLIDILDVFEEPDQKFTDEVMEFLNKIPVEIIIVFQPLLALLSKTCFASI